MARTTQKPPTIRLKAFIEALLGCTTNGACGDCFVPCGLIFHPNVFYDVTSLVDGVTIYVTSYSTTVVFVPCVVVPLFI